MRATISSPQFLWIYWILGLAPATNLLDVSPLDPILLHDACYNLKPTVSFDLLDLLDSRFVR
jgi:hypothetical protein